MITEMYVSHPKLQPLIPTPKERAKLSLSLINHHTMKTHGRTKV
jgi:hypothetical protein